MFRIIQGAPGSGKTFYAVNYLKKFTKYDKLYETMNLDSDVLLVTNIDEVKVQHMKVDEFRGLDLIEPETCRNYMRTHNYRRVVYIHDEAQRTFGGIKDNREFFFFEYHRHLGMDVFLIVQTVSSLPRRLTEICEYVIDAKPRTLGVIGFSYDIKDPKTGGKLGTITLKKDQNVFRLYKSFDMKEIERPKKVVFRKLVIGAAIIVLSFGMISYLIKYTFNTQVKGESKKAIVLPSKTKQKTPEKVRKAKEEKKPPDSQYYVYIPGQDAKGARPNGRLKGVSETNKGVFFFYDKE